jgi:hypothetical protein
MGIQYSSPPQPPAQNNNRTIIIIVVVVLLLCCCCFIAGLGYWLWNNGDELMRQIEQSTSALPSLLPLI